MKCLQHFWHVFTFFVLSQSLVAECLGDMLAFILDARYGQQSINEETGKNAYSTYMFIHSSLFVFFR